MRVTESYKFFNYHANQQRVMGNLNNTIGQISSGLKIKFGNEDPTAFINTLRLDQEVNTLNQSTANMNSAQKFANHTDVALGDMTRSLEQFKTKLIYAANDEHSQTSYGALATELKAIRDHMVNLANTNINGEYLFSGSATSVKPISNDGTYNGNDLQMKTLTGSNIQSPYNITGADLFLGQDSDYSKKITTNVVLYNQTKLHPAVMNSGATDDSSAKQEFIKTSDTVRDLVGDNDDNPNNDGEYYFYVSGVKSGGQSFQEKITMDTTSSVDALLGKIGEAYGNTSFNKVVDVRMNQGRIEIEDLQRGSSKLDFHMFGSSEDNDDIDALVSGGADIKEFVKSPYRSVPTIDSISTAQDKIDPSIHTVNSTLRTENGVARGATQLSDIFPNGVANINLSGVDSDGNAVATTVAVAGSSVNDILAAIEANFGDVSASITQQGKIQIVDRSGENNFTLDLATTDAADDPIVGFGNDMASMQTMNFEVKDATVKSNVAQVISATNEFAKDSTKLSEVASGGSVEGSQFVLHYTDVHGTQREATIDFDAAGVSVNPAGGVAFNILSHDGTQTLPDDMTYRQLQDAVGMLVTQNMPDGTDDLDNYRQNVQLANNRAEVFVDQNGMFTIKEKNTTQTNIRFAMHDNNVGDFSTDAAKMTFSANNALVIDDVHVDMFKMLDDAILAVENGFTRPDGGNDTMMRSVGIQNLIEKLDHVHDHTVRRHTQIGATSQSFDYQISRNETLVVHTKTLRSEIVDIDYAEAAMKLQQLQLNYQAMASSIAKVQGLSLINYL